MRKLFLTTMSLLTLVLMLFNCTPSGDKTKNNVATKQAAEEFDSSRVFVYYFHGKQRCQTCLTVQQLTETIVNENFKNNELVLFKEIDFSNPTNEALADKYEVSTSSLIIAKGSKYENLTEVAFMNVFRNPDEIRNAIVSRINNMLTE